MTATATLQAELRAILADATTRTLEYQGHTTQLGYIGAVGAVDK